MPNIEHKSKKEKDKQEEMGYCAKDGEYRPIKKGCPHPKDYCPHRKACMIYFLSNKEDF